ncbi:MAG: hypothetical protein KGJ24_04775 [Burkholderiales bacterium]|nr:hypothetical protein [Burkholderiales bacterium]
MNPPNPALVTLRGARRLPRLPLLLLCAAYLLPGLVGRDPWRNADLTAYAQMAAIAEGRTPWWAPTLGGVPADTALLPHWLGAAAIVAGSPWLDPAVAARIPFAILLALTFGLVWYSSFHLARTEAAQPLPFAFGGEADPLNYARAIADGALLALMATLGLLQLGHETTPELAQLAAMSLLLYALAAAPFRARRSRAAVLASLPLLAGSGAPSMALAAGLGAWIVCRGSPDGPVRALRPWIAAGLVLAALLAAALGAWHLRTDALTLAGIGRLLRQWLWFLWPVWPLALWTLWRWRHRLTDRHLAVPLVPVAVALMANIAMAGSDRALMLGLPGMAVLAAFALPTLSRGAAAAIDWLSMCYFTLWALVFWVLYCALQTGVPASTAGNLARLLPGYVSHFSAPALALALLGTGAWVAVVRWRTGRHREALWKSLVLPAGGVALCWLLAMTLLLPALDYARSARPWVDRIAALLPPGACIAAPGLAAPEVAALEAVGHWAVDARSGAAAGPCPVLLLAASPEAKPAPPGWRRLGTVVRPTDREDVTTLYLRAAAAPPPAAPRAR